MSNTGQQYAKDKSEVKARFTKQIIINKHEFILKGTYNTKREADAAKRKLVDTKKVIIKKREKGFVRAYGVYQERI